MAAALKKALGLEVSLLKGDGGVFEVAVDGKVVASRQRFAFPTEQEIVSAVQGALAQQQR